MARIVIAHTIAGMTRYYWILLIIGGVPLLIYPFILLANVMSLAGTKSSTPVPLMQTLTANAFLWSSTLYPLVYIGCGIAAIVYASGGNSEAAFKLSVVPLLYVVLCVLLMFAWMTFGA